MTRIIMIHGVRAVNTFQSLAPTFLEAGFSVVIPKYGFVPATVIGLFQWLDYRLATTIASFVQPDDILLGHSNGGAICYLISKLRPVRATILVNPALDSSLAPVADFSHVYFNRGDLVTALASFIPCHLWGDMGAVGYRGQSNDSITNIDAGQPPLASLPPLDGHTAIFLPENVRLWGEYMAQKLSEELAARGKA